jgi:hypothetical protein
VVHDCACFVLSRSVNDKILLDDSASITVAVVVFASNGNLVYRAYFLIQRELWRSSCIVEVETLAVTASIAPQLGKGTEVKVRNASHSMVLQHELAYSEGNTLNHPFVGWVESPRIVV